MAPAKLEKTTVTIAADTTQKRNFEAKGEVVVFDGFLRVYGRAKQDEILPQLHSGDSLSLAIATARQVFARPPARYTEGSLVKKLEELGIGRPSTYATIINTIQTRGYVVKGDSEGMPREVIELTFTPDAAVVKRELQTENTGSTKGKLVPTASGELIAGFLNEHFTPVVDYGFTAHVEEEFDAIANGTLERNTMLDEFYAPFHALVKKGGDIDRSTVAQAREVGTDPKTGKTIYARIGKFGPLLQLGDGDGKDEKPQFAPMPKSVRIEDVTLEQALHAFELPREVGTTEDGQIIKANIGRFGPYIQVGKLFVSIKSEDPHTITEETARELYAAKLKADAEKFVSDFGDGIQVLRGRYGPYVTDGKKNAKLPKDTAPEKITHEEAKKILASAPDKPAKRRFTRKRKTK